MRRLSFGQQGGPLDTCEGRSDIARKAAHRVMLPSSPLGERDRLPTIWDADPSISCDSDDDGDSRNDDEGDKLGRSALSAMEPMVSLCCVPGCTIGAIDIRTSQHRCRSCGGFFHALCAFKYSGSDDVTDCGCLSRKHGSLQEVVQAGSPLPDTLHPPQDLPPQFIPAWLNGADVTSKLRKPPKEFSAPEANVWLRAKEALRAWIKSEQRRARRAGVKRPTNVFEGSGHTVDPEYCAAANKAYEVPEVGAKKRAPKPSVGEIARLAHVLVDPSLRIATEIIMQGWSTRAELDDKNGRENPWESIAQLFNDATFKPANFYVDRADGFDQVLDIDPSYLPHGERGSLQLQGWFAEKKSKINIYKSHWGGPSGLNASGDQLPRMNFVQGDLGGLYIWEVMEDANLFGMVRKNLPENVAHSTQLPGATSSWDMPDPTPPSSRAAR